MVPCWFTGHQWQQLDGRCLHLFTSQTRPYTTCYLFYFSVVLYCSRAIEGRLTCHWSWDFKRSVCHILSLISVDRNVICSLILGWANCGSPVLHLLSMQLPANFLSTSQFPPETASAKLTLTLSITLVPFPSSSPSPPLNNAVPALTYCGTSSGHHKASNTQPELISLHGLTNITPVYPPPSQSSSLLSFILFLTSISPRRQGS